MKKVGIILIILFLAQLSVYAERNDRVIWKFNIGREINSSPAIGSDGTIYIGSFDGKLYAINSDGSLK